MREKSRKV